MKKTMKLNGWQDFVELCIASWIFVAPFFLGFFSNIPATLSCMLIGGLIFSTSMLGLARETPGFEWATLGLSVLLISSPWLFAYSQISLAVFNAVIAGALLILFSTLAMVHEYSQMDDKKDKTTPAH